MLELNPDGTVTVHLLERDVLLRRPSVGEYRTLRESIEKLQAAHSEVVAGAQAENDEYREALLARPEEFDKDEWQAKADRSRDNLRRVQDSADDLRLSWFVEVLAALGDGTPAADQVPSVVFDARWPVELQTHWRTRPTHPGAK